MVLRPDPDPLGVLTVPTDPTPPAEQRCTTCHGIGYRNASRSVGRDELHDMEECNVCFGTGSLAPTQPAAVPLPPPADVPIGHPDWPMSVMRQLEAERAAREKLQAFKDWVHSYLDGVGVPHHPPGTHGAAGCRIGDRMDWLMDGYKATNRELAAVRAARPVGVRIGTDGLCQCSCADVCPLGKRGSETRCTEGQLKTAGIPTALAGR